MNVIHAVDRVVEKIRKRIATRRRIEFIRNHATELRELPVGAGRYKVALHFPDEMDNAYQLRQWYEPLVTLAEFVPVVILVRSPETALSLREECPLPIHYAPAVDDMERLMHSQDLRVVFYVNQNIRNFQALRFNGPNHVFICHGESEKAYMWSNQLKAYDYVFSAGEAAKDRLAKHLRNFDPSERCRLIGRPQIDVNYTPPVTVNEELPTLLYAPTWEGDRPSMNYGSALSHGELLINALLKDGGFNIIFRPHPRSGMSAKPYGQAVERIRKRLDAHDDTSHARFIFDDSSHWGWQWSIADLCVTDISAVAYDFLATGKPMFVTSPVSGDATIDDSPALRQVPALPAQQADEIVSLAHDALNSNDPQLREMVEYYFGDISQGASMQRFVAETLSLVHEDSIADR